MEIVLPLGFADAIFRRERSDDWKCVCCSQATVLYDKKLMGTKEGKMVRKPKSANQSINRSRSFCVTKFKG